MRIATLALMPVLAGLIATSTFLHAEDWTTSDGKIYKNIQIREVTPAYVTILHEDGGGQVPLSSLNADLQKRFSYDPAKAQTFLADRAAALQQVKVLAQEKVEAQVRAANAERERANAVAFYTALFSAPPDLPSSSSNSGSGSTDRPPVDSDDSVAADNQQPISSEPPTAIDDYGYGDYGGYGYGGYGGSYYSPYSYYSPQGHGYGYRRNNNHYGTRGFNHGVTYGRSYPTPARSATPSATTRH